MNSDIQQILDQAKELLKDEMSQISHKTWIEPLKIASITDNNMKPTNNARVIIIIGSISDFI